MAEDLSLSLWGNSLTDTQVRNIIRRVNDNLNSPPSHAITLFHYEGLWGGSNVANANNNWGGMTWNNSWTSPHTRASGVVVTRGTSRPSVEGGYYIRYNNYNDYLTDWLYLMRRNGAYRVADTNTFSDAVKGQFRYGGAVYDYATMNVNNSKQRYELYLQGITARRNAINQANNNLLDRIDSGDIDWDDNPPIKPEFPDELDPIIRDINNLISEMRNSFSDFEKNIFDTIMNLVRVKLYDFSKKQFGNKFLKIDKLMDNMYILQPNLNFLDKIGQDIFDVNDILDRIEGSLGDLETGTDPPNTDPNPTPSNRPAFPTTQGLKITSGYGYRGNIGVPGASQYHWSIDIGGGGVKHPIYATQDGEVIQNVWNDLSGWRIRLKHTHPNDNYYSQYQHLDVQSPLAVGTTVNKGDRIGTMGTTGASSGIHLDFAISKNGTFFTQSDTIDPRDYLKMSF